MVKDIKQIYKNSQYQLSTLSIKTPVPLHLSYQTSSSIEFTKTSVTSVSNKKQTNSVLCSKNSIHDDLSITNNYDIQSCETVIKQNYSIPTISTPNHHAQLFAATSVNFLNFHTTTILSPVGKEYIGFHNNCKNSQASKCIKPRIMTKVIYYVIYIDTF